jgi:proteic killer suppression protein
VIRSFRHRGLELFFTKSDLRKIPSDRAARIERLLDRLEAAERPADMNLPGYRWHQLKGDRKGTHAVDVSGNLRLTFKFDGGNAFDIDLEDYH